MLLDGPSVTLEEDDGTGTLGSGSEDSDDSLEAAAARPSLDRVRDDVVQRGEEREKGLGGLGELRISGLLRMVLQDAQTRLVFKAQSVMQSEIRWFVPSPGSEEVDWPGILEGGESERYVCVTLHYLRYTFRPSFPLRSLFLARHFSRESNCTME